MPVPVVDTTGAGDACTAGITVALAEGTDLDVALALGNAAGAVAVQRGNRWGLRYSIGDRRPAADGC
ncbi:PfkB family carbohydrate kinase [Microbacterium sp. NPDC058062]|uniref:PfkB family carbohydrate kinase n=1 Tax=Microbacterium sp. NPDC058062 TaxID=3346320 RepID=UPI0036D9B92A